MSERTYTDDDVRYVMELAYEQAFLDAQRVMAERAAAADLSWSLFKRLLPPEQCVAQRYAEMLAWRTRAFPGRADHPGGPVDWETGKPLRARL